ncbi:MAG: hypothetical protein AAGF74_07645 [Pseudomonadota bacterium]
MTEDWAERIELAMRLKGEGMDTALAWDPSPLPSSFEYDVDDSREVWLKKYKERRFARALIEACILSKLLIWKDVAICSPTGVVMKPNNAFFLHSDRLDWCFWHHPIRETLEFRKFYELFDEGSFTSVDLFERFCCIDAVTGLITEKNNSVARLTRALHGSSSPDAAQSVFDRGVRPFLGWAIVWHPSDVPETLSELFEQIGILEAASLKPEGRVRASRAGRPRKIEPALSAYNEMYPAGHEILGDSWKMVAKAISDRIGICVSEDTIRRALGKKK